MRGRPQGSPESGGKLFAVRPEQGDGGRTQRSLGAGWNACREGFWSEGKVSAEAPCMLNLLNMTLT